MYPFLPFLLCSPSLAPTLLSSSPFCPPPHLSTSLTLLFPYLCHCLICCTFVSHATFPSLVNSLPLIFSPPLLSLPPSLYFLLYFLSPYLYQCFCFNLSPFAYSANSPLISPDHQFIITNFRPIPSLWVFCFPCLSKLYCRRS